MAGTALKSLVLLGLAAGLLTGCEPGTSGDAVTSAPLADSADATAAPIAPATSVRLVDHDVEAPQDFQVTDKALWDGRPSLGGVWVAATNVTDPMRVIMRNPKNGKFVIGALFRREADNPGPKLQISSDAADALGLVAGEPATLNVTALRREETPVQTPDASKPLLDSSETLAGRDAAAIGSAAIAAVAPAQGKPAATATPAPAAQGKPAPVQAAAATPPGKPVPAQPAAPATPAKPAPAKPAAAQPTAAPAPAAAASPAAAPAVAPAISGNAIQIGIFSVEANANRAVATLAKAGISATVRQETSHGKPLWSVVAAGDAAVLGQIKKAGFKDAYFLKR